MGRPPCCAKFGIKKGPWTPEEDIILVSYIQEHGPGNWRSVPTNTGLLRCSKSCRLRWTNYLRPGIRRGNFTPHEEGMIIHLQALLGNKWAAIASYLPQRTDNDIKNYWNTHLKKRMKNFQAALDNSMISHSSTSKSYSETNPSSFISCSTYACSTENISRLLERWMKASPKATTTLPKEQKSNEKINAVTTASSQSNLPKSEEKGCDVTSQEDLENLFSFESWNKMAWEKSSTDSTSQYSFLEKWFLNEATGQVEDMMDLSLDCYSAYIF